MTPLISPPSKPRSLAVFSVLPKLMSFKVSPLLRAKVTSLKKKNTAARLTSSLYNFSIDEVRNRSSYYGVAFDGYIYVSQDGWYFFYTKSDDGSKLYINNQNVVNNDGIHGWQERGGWINLQAGYHRIDVDFFSERWWPGSGGWLPRPRYILTGYPFKCALSD